MSSIDFDDDLILFNLNSLGDDEHCPQDMSDLSTRTSQSINPSPIKSNKTKMSDITDLLEPTEFNHQQNDVEHLSMNIVDSLHRHTLQNDQDNYEKLQWEMEENHLKYGSKQLSPSDYLTRTSLYNRPVAFEKDSRVWARSLLDNFKKPNPKSKSYYIPIMKKSSSFDRHVEYVEHLNECNDYPAYLEYIRENRSQLFYTLTDSIDIIDGLIGTIVSSY